MFSLSDDGTIKSAISLQCSDTTHTFYKSLEDCLAQKHMVGLFEIDQQHMKVYISMCSYVCQAGESSDIEWTNLFPLTPEKLFKPHLYSV